MPRFDQVRVPAGTSRKWEIVIEEDREPLAAGPTTAAEVKPEHRLLHDIPTPRLRGVPLLPTGVGLDRGAVYLDLHDPARGEFRASGYERVRPGQRVIPRANTPPDVWRAVLDAADRLLRPRADFVRVDVPPRRR